MRYSPSFQEKWSIFLRKKQENSCVKAPDALILSEMPEQVSRVERDKDANINSHFTCAAPNER